MNMLQKAKSVYWYSYEAGPVLTKFTKEHLAPSRVLLKSRVIAKALAKSIVTIEGVKLRLGMHLPPKVREQIVTERYEGPELRIVRETLGSDDVVMELGTGLGLLASYCAKKIGSERVFTFEGNPALQQMIEETFLLNSVSPHCELCLVADQEGEEIFYVHKHFWASSILPHKHAEKSVVAKRDFNKELKRTAATYLIIDIEGGEWGLSQYMQLHGVRKIMIEMHPWRIGQQKVDEVDMRICSKGFERVVGLSTDSHYFYKRKGI